METFADYIFNEKDYLKKLSIMYFLEKKADVFFDNSVIFKTTLAKLFMEYAKINVNHNLVITACLLCACKKSDNPREYSKISTYAKQGVEYLESLGFSKRFCKICEEQNRYSGSQPREKESDILELVDQFGGMLLHRPERMGFPVDEALCLLEHRNLKGKNNIYLEQFIEFIEEMEELKIFVGVKKEEGTITGLAHKFNTEDRDNVVSGMKIVLDVESRMKNRLVKEKIS